MRIEYDLTPEHLEQLCRFYFDEWWTHKRTREDAEEAFTNSYVCVALDDADEVVGFARAVSDGVFFAWVADVMTRPDQRGTGVGRAVMDGILAHPRLQRVTKWDLICLPELEEFYGRWGFGDTAPLRTIRRDLAPPNWDEFT